MGIIGYEIQDNNNRLVITEDGRERPCGIDIYYHEEIGYFFDDSFTPSEIEQFGFDVLESIKTEVLIELNRSPKQVG